MTSIPVPEEYGISADYGFVSYDASLVTLDPNYIRWEDIASDFQRMLRKKCLRNSIDRLPVLDTSNLITEGEWRRAYVLLVFMLHGYVWEGSSPEEKIPPQLTVPLYEVCQTLELPPIATFAGVCLWNFKLLDPSKPIHDLDYLAYLQTFTGTSDGKWFYLVSVAIEARGAPIIPLMLQAIDAARAGKREKVQTHLEETSVVLEEINSLLQKMHERVDPHVFYNELRPYLAGSKSMAEAGLPHGLSEYRQLSGGSNAQSSLIQFTDIVLGVEHHPTGSNNKPGVTSEAGKKRSFSHEMRSYMPGPHRRFLEDVEEVSNIHEFVKARRHNPGLSRAYNKCLEIFSSMREKHFQIVARYVIAQSHKRKEEGQSLKPASESVVNIVNSTSSSSEARGTGGTSVVPFLKQTREETVKPILD
ncbi:uncharacterized protein N7503_007318 [Penicillium pulvis]|uniref:uncharacterized protein n=1 Tax=Penicillium pulvis TaxID=1562058 RepID=UPI00254909DF|nr:uncharacterized protein N7503_007318 [Penicillium pulvis]KAJ5798022.1 hypothetical protein N7503_007318 [Penicillium pulvis]